MRRIGIIGGGQLGRMAIEEAGKYEARVSILASDWPCPAGDLADEIVLGALTDRAAIRELAAVSDVVSCEIEHVDVASLRELEAEGKTVIPSADVLAIIQDKAAQKRLWDESGIPTSAWRLVEGDPPSGEALSQAADSIGGFPVVQKARRGGYDGRGVAVLASASDGILSCASFVERKVELSKELAVIVARGEDGSVAAYPCVEMVFDSRANLCDSVLAPARVDEATRKRAAELALACVQALDKASRRAAGSSPTAGAAGVFGVEMFLAASGEILVNEVAPRPHNSGHYSIEACASSQFDQYLRILLGLPLGSPELLRPAMMVNLLGEPGGSGEPRYEGLGPALAVPGVAVHLYGKREVRPFRKMGHLTAIGGTVEEAIARASAARDLVRVLAS